MSGRDQRLADQEMRREVVVSSPSMALKVGRSFARGAPQVEEALFEQGGPLVLENPSGSNSGRPNGTLAACISSVAVVSFISFAIMVITPELSPRHMAALGPSEARQAREAARALALDARPNRRHAVRLTPDEGPAQNVEVPESAFRLFLEILHQMGQGHAVTLVPTHHELTTQEAADLLSVSRPYFVKLLETDVIPHHRVGNRRRVKFEHLMGYLERVKGESHEALEQLAAQAQELGMGY